MMLLDGFSEEMLGLVQWLAVDWTAGKRRSYTNGRHAALLVSEDSDDAFQGAPEETRCSHHMRFFSLDFSDNSIPR